MIQASQRLSRLVVVIAAAALLTPASFAAIALALALTDLVRGALLAFDVGAVRRLARGSEPTAVVQTSLDAKGLASVVGLGVVAALALLLYDRETVWLIAVSGVGGLAASFGSSFLVERQAGLALRAVSTRIAAAGIAGAALAVLLVWLTRSALGVASGLAVGDVLLLALVTERHGWRWPDWRAAVAEVRESQSLLIMQLAYAGQFRVGTIILATTGAAIAVGEYAIASRVAEGLVVLAAALTASSLPLMGAAHAQDEREGLSAIFERSYRVAIGTVAPLVAAIVIAAPIWIGMLFPRYPEVGSPSAVVGLAVMIFFASSQTTTLLNATHRDRAAGQSAVAGLAASLLASMSLASFGAIGVAWGRVAGELVRFLVEAAAGISELRIRPAALVRPWLVVSPVMAGTTIAVVTGWQRPFVWIAALIVLAGTSMLLATSRRNAGPSA